MTSFSREPSHSAGIAPAFPAVALGRKSLLSNASVEVSARDAGAPKALAAHIGRGARVHVTFLPNVDYREVVAASRALAEEGFVPVPHIAARSLTDKAALSDYVSRLSNEAGVRRVLLIAGDLDKPRGPFADCLSVLQTDALQRQGITSVAFAGHPEGHPQVSNEIMLEALMTKVAFAKQNGLDPSVITQLCFESATILDWVRHMRSVGMAAPISIGAAAPTNPLMLAKFALRCGVGPSLRALTTQTARLGQLLTDAGPERIIADLAKGMSLDEHHEFGAVTSMHFFVFSAAAKAASWLAAQQSASAVGIAW